MSEELGILIVFGLQFRQVPGTPNQLQSAISEIDLPTLQVSDRINKGLADLDDLVYISPVPLVVDNLEYIRVYWRKSSRLLLGRIPTADGADGVFVLLVR